MRVALVGARGQLGADIIKTKPEGIELIPLTRKELDITDRSRVREVMGELKPEIIINTAGYVRVDDAEDAAEEAFKINSIGAKILAETSQEVKAILLHISTDYVFDGGKKPIPYNEEDVANPINAYARSKYAGEIFVQNYAEKYYLIRTASLYGKLGARGKGGNFVYTILNKAKNKEALIVVNDTYMSPTYTHDLSKSIWDLILERKPYGTYHITNSGYCSWYEFAKKILELSRMETDVVPVSHTEYKTKAERPLWTSLVSIRGIKLRDWRSALEEFIKDVIKEV